MFLKSHRRVTQVFFLTLFLCQDSTLFSSNMKKSLIQDNNKKQRPRQQETLVCSQVSGRH